jgi:hypothetical protein
VRVLVFESERGCTFGEGVERNVEYMRQRWNQFHFTDDCLGSFTRIHI